MKVVFSGSGKKELNFDSLGDLKQFVAGEVLRVEQELKEVKRKQKELKLYARELKAAIGEEKRAGEKMLNP